MNALTRTFAIGFTLTASLGLSGVGVASEIGSGGSVEMARAHDIHETITDLAIECIDRSEGIPSDCSDLHDEISARSIQNRREDVLSLSYAARWPDDPTRLLNQTATQIRFGLPLYQGCSVAMAGSGALNRAGLLCSSHFGRLQFMHAMMAPTGPTEVGEQRRLILDWADFAFRAGTNASFASQDYCSTVDKLDNLNLKAALTFDNALEESSFCKTRKHPVFFWKIYQPWKVSSLFAFSCEEPVNLNTCGVESDIIARQAAWGAIVHLIQDSFSQSHASRMAEGDILPSTGPFDAIVVCSKPKTFYVYQEQTATDDTHKSADALPDLHENCLSSDRIVDDVITATAKAIFFLQQQDIDGFNGYMSARVFPEA